MRSLSYLFGFLLFSCTTNQYSVVINAEETDRHQSIIRLLLPEGIAETASGWEVVNRETGTATAVQITAEGQAVFVLDQPLSAGGERAYLLRPAKAPQVYLAAATSDQELVLKTGDQPILTYNISTDCPPAGLPEYYCRSGYIHPLYSPGGAIVTDDFPVGHTHQHGLFLAWVNTTFRGDFTDFWNQQNETGTAAHRELISTTSGPVFCGFSSDLQQISRKHGPVLEEHWYVSAYDLGQYYIIDLVSDQKNITTDTLYINKYHYGGLGVRGSRLWNQSDTLAFQSEAEFLTSEGKNRIEANHTRPHWTAMYGQTDKGIAGVVIFDHPDNFRHPQPVRVHPEMPYFCQAPMVEAAIPIAPGAAYVSRYRIATFDGKPDRKELDELWSDYASPIEGRLAK